GERQLASYVSKMRDRFDVIVIDGSAKLEEMLVAALKVADYVMIPVQPSNADVWAVADLVDLLKTRQKLTEGSPRGFFLISRQIQHTALADSIESVLEEYELPILESRTTQRVAYAEALSVGSSVTRFEPSGKAAQEI